MRQFKFNFIKCIVVPILISVICSCSVDPTVADSDVQEFNSIEDFENMINGVYVDLANFQYMGTNYIIIGEIMADNVYANGANNSFTSFSRMNVKPVQSDRNDNSRSLWRHAYSAIGKSNLIINGESDQLQAGDMERYKHIRGEAYAIRAFSHFNLLTLYGQRFIDEGDDLGVPYAKEYKPSESNIPRESVDDNLAHIYEDLAEAIKLFEESKDYEENNLNKLRFSLDAVYALKSRIGVFYDDYATVREVSERLIEKYPLTPADEYLDYWKNDSPGSASIFELFQSNSELKDPNSSDVNAPIAESYRPSPSDGHGGDIQAFDNLIQDAEFDQSDVRASMIGYDSGGRLRNMGKFPTMDDLGSDNIKVFRIAEIVLNYAEALMDVDKSKSLNLLNMVALNRNANPYPEINMENILKERRKELMFEGFRFFDLARTRSGIRAEDPNTVNRHGEVEPGSYRFALPIPNHEIDSNSELVQNPGY